MIVQIGETAGKIWQLLDMRGDLTLAQIKNEIKSDNFVLVAAIGWLARENKVLINKSGRSLKMRLR
ncbi:winged helix-turn-helix domain-containing protein [candidate division KSB1 bacterium]|nr:winged helix-turn-helix domain-containing protein [candidate division KSB1 bacterium]